MSELELLLEDIEKLRLNLTKIIEEKQFDLLDADVQAASKLLNTVLLQYNDFIKNKVKKQ